MKIDVKKAIKLISEKKSRKVSKREIAKEIGVNHQLLTELETKNAPKQIRYMKKLADLAGVKIEDLIIKDE